jgi:hypothetical protein
MSGFWDFKLSGTPPLLSFGVDKRVNRLSCPRCEAAYPRRRIPFGPRGFRCLSCDARLTFSRDSARRVGAVGGFTLFGAAALGGLVFGFDQIWTWRFMVPFVAFAVVVGHATKVLVGVLEVRDGPR